MLERFDVVMRTMGQGGFSFMSEEKSPSGKYVLYADAQATIADLQGQLATAKAPRVYDCGSCAIGKGFEQRVAQLEGERADWKKAIDSHVEITTKHMLRGDLAEAKLITLQADHTRVLGLVAGLLRADERGRGVLFEETLRDMAKFANWDSRTLTASLPAQPAQGGAKCVWIDDGGGTYATGCKEYFQVYAESEEAPQWVKFCCYCGKSVEHFADTEGETRA